MKRFTGALTLASLLLGTVVAPAIAKPPVPTDLTPSGKDSDGTPLYVCTALRPQDNSIQPGKIRLDQQTCNYGYDGKEVAEANNFIYIKAPKNLISAWRQGTSAIPTQLYPSGLDKNGKSQAFCRTTLTDKSIQLGRVTYQNGYLRCSVGYRGKEVFGNNFQYLIINAIG
jgi:opacity protein-like surface antigen